MNKTLLLILCDFLLLTLLALTRWESAEPPRPTQAQQAVPELAANAVTKEQDLVETMRQSLADERSVREELAQKLSSADAALAAREQNLAQLQAERAKLAEERNAVSSTLTETQRAAAELSQKFNAATQEATMTKEQLAQLQRELAERQAEADRQRIALANLEKQHADARKQIEGLTLAVVVSEQEKKNLRETAEGLKGQVEVERTERIKVQETATQLAQGVGQLAEKSGELTKEIRENRPINANVLFNDYLANRVTATFNATRRVFIGSPNRNKDANTVLVTDGRQVYALLHIADTIFSLGENGIDWESLSVQLARGGANRSAAGAVQFLARDPRLVVLPLDASQAAALGAKIYPIAADPFRFPEAVLIDGGGRGYGEVGFKLDPADPNFVRVDNRFFKRVFGDFAPKRGDLVFAKSGELLGVMVNNDYCAVIKDFAAQKTIQAGADIRAQNTGAVFDDLIARVRSLPLKLQ
jgi:X-X-X-Leu-X-X-Gly heptad repeat protein